MIINKTLLKQIYYRLFYPNQKKVAGKKNKISIKNSLMRNNNFHIKGENNFINAHEDFLYNASFIIFGNHNQINIKKNSTLSGCEIWIEGDYNVGILANMLP